MANILLVEDDPDITFAVSMGLTRAGHVRYIKPERKPREKHRGKPTEE